MLTELSPNARKQAQQLRRQLQRGQSVVMLSGGEVQGKKSLAELQHWCEEQGVGQPLRADGGWRFDYQSLAQFEQALNSLGLMSLDEQPSQTRIGRLQQGAQEYKSLGEAPLRHRVLCSHYLPDNPVAVTHAPARWVLDMDWWQIDSSAYDGLLVVENADVFYACGSTDWQLPDALSGHLVVYRGHDYRATGLKALQQHWDGLPQVYFGDIDPKGVSIALHEGYSHLLLPPLEFFRGNATALHAPAEQEASQRYLANHITRTINKTLKEYLKILVEGRGLRQQSVLKMPLSAVAIA